MLPLKYCFKPIVGVICRTGIIDSHKIKRSSHKFRLTPYQLAEIFLTLLEVTLSVFVANTTFKWSANGIIILTKSEHDLPTLSYCHIDHKSCIVTCIHPNIQQSHQYPYIICVIQPFGSVITRIDRVIFSYQVYA